MKGSSNGGSSSDTGSGSDTGCWFSIFFLEPSFLGVFGIDVKTHWNLGKQSLCERWHSSEHVLIELRHILAYPAQWKPLSARHVKQRNIGCVNSVHSGARCCKIACEKKLSFSNDDSCSATHVRLAASHEQRITNRAA